VFRDIFRRLLWCHASYCTTWIFKPGCRLSNSASRMS
jgi:hypothetical protein